METTPRPESDGTPPGVSGDSRLWLLPVLGLAVWQGWITLTLFGGERPWDGLRDERPIVSGKHPLHLYHGYLGARAFLRQGSTSCYDPSFQAGYPKTPVFDGGSRPAEVFLTLAGGDYRPEVYKTGLAVSCLLVPLILCVASRGIGLSRRGVFVSVLLGLMVWWGRPCQQLLHDGDLDLLLAGLAAVALSGLLIRYDRKPGARSYLGTLLAGFLGWLFHPLLLALLLPVYLLYYLSVGARHRMIWSVLLLGGLFLAVAANYYWLRDWIDYWWLRVPFSASDLLLPHRTLGAIWRAPLWGEGLDRGLAIFLLLSGTVGCVLLNQRGNRPAARVFGLSALFLVTLSLGGIVNDMLGRFNATNLLVPGLLFAVPLAAHMVDCSWIGLQKATRRWWVSVPGLVLPLGSLLLMPGVLPILRERVIRAEKLRLGLGDSQQQVVEQLRQHTTTEARILWENVPRDQPAAGWTALLPVLTDRYYLGGLDAGGGIEHTTDGLCGQCLGARPLDEWSDGELADYFRRFNIGWVACWSAPARDRLARWPAARPVTQLGSGNGWLFSIQRERSFILKGKARWLGAEVSRIRLADVEPEDGVIVLSLHFQKGFVASPSRVKVEALEDARQDLSLILLRVQSPVAHLTLTWQK